MLNKNELATYLLKHPSLKGPLMISPVAIAIEWIDPVILPEEIIKLENDTGRRPISFTYMKDKLYILLSLESPK